MPEQNFAGAVPPENFFASQEETEYYLATPTPKRVFAIARALQVGYSLEKIHDLTGIDSGLLRRIKHIVDAESAIQAHSTLDTFTTRELREIKQLGISDRRIAELTGYSELEVRMHRQQLEIVPSVFRSTPLLPNFHLI